MRVAVVFTLLLAFAANAFGQTYWSKIVLPQSVAADVYFTTPQVGFLATDDGIFKSMDSGFNWSRVAFTGSGAATYDSAQFTQIHFINANVGFASAWINRVGTGDTWLVFRTADAGATWQPVYTRQISATNGKGPYNYHFINSSIGYAVSLDVLLKTVDGGLNWSLLTTGNNLRDTYFWSEQVGVVGGTYRSYVTQNGGASWDTISVTFNDVQMVDDTLYYCSNKIRFTTDTFATTDTLDIYYLNGLFDYNELALTSSKKGFVASFGVLRTTEGNVLEKFNNDSVRGSSNIHYVNDTLLFALGTGNGSTDPDLYRCAQGGGAPIPNAYFKADLPNPFEACVNTPVTFINLSEPGYTYEWRVNNVLESTAKDLVKTFTSPGTYTITLKITRGSATGSYLRNITISEPSTLAPATLTVTDTIICDGSTVSYNLSMPRGLIRYKITANGQQVALVNGDVNGPTTKVGTFGILSSAYIQLTAYSACDTMVYDSFLVVKLPPLNTNYGMALAASTICLGDSAEILMPLSNAGYQYQPYIRSLTGNTLVDTFSIKNGGGSLSWVFPAADKDWRIFMRTFDPVTGCTALLPARDTVLVDSITPNLVTYPLNPDINEPIHLINYSQADSFTSQWSILPSTATPLPQGQNATVQISTPGIYTALLTVTTPRGCVKQKESEPFQVYDHSAYQIQQPAWAFELGQYDTLQRFRMETDLQGNIYVAFARLASNELDTLLLNGNFGIKDTLTNRYYTYLVKYDVNGAAQWQMKSGPHNIQPNSTIQLFDIGPLENGIYFATRVTGTTFITYPNGALDTLNPGITSLGATYLYKIRGDGQIEWRKFMGNIAFAEFESCPQTGEFLINSSRLRKYDSAGVLLWEVHDIYSKSTYHIDKAGNVYFANESGSMTFIDALSVSHTLPNYGSGQAHLVKLSPNGALDWYLTVRSGGRVKNGKITTDKDLNIYCALFNGSPGCSISHSNATGIDTVANTRGITLLKLNSAGRKLWYNGMTMQGNYQALNPYDIGLAVDSIGRAVMWGDMYSPLRRWANGSIALTSIGFPPIPTNINIRNQADSAYTFSLHYSPLGNLVHHQIDTIYKTAVTGPLVKYDNQGNLVYASRYESNNGHYSFYNEHFTGSKDAMFLAKRPAVNVPVAGIFTWWNTYEYCIGDTIQIFYQVGDSLTIAPPNVYSISLVDINNPLNVYPVASVAGGSVTGSVTGIVPTAVPAGRYYIQFTSSATAHVSLSSDIVLINRPGGTTTSITARCVNDTIHLTAPGTQHQWYPTNLVTTPTSWNVSVPLLQDTTVWATYNTVCGISTDTFNLNTRYFQPLEVVKDTTFLCSGTQVFTFGVDSIPGATYEWDGNYVYFDDEDSANTEISVPDNNHSHRGSLTIDYDSLCPALEIPFTVTISRPFSDYIDNIFVFVKDSFTYYFNMPTLTDIQWWNGDQGEMLNIYAVREGTTTGSFTAINEDGCLIEDEFTINATIKPVVGVNNLSNDAYFTLYPNPYTDVFTLELNTTTGTLSDDRWQIKVFSIHGELVHSSNPMAQNGLVSINLADIAAGMYILQVEMDDLTVRYKLNKQ